MPHRPRLAPCPQSEPPAFRTNRRQPQCRPSTRSAQPSVSASASGRCPHAPWPNTVTEIVKRHRAHRQRRIFGDFAPLPGSTRCFSARGFAFCSYKGVCSAAQFESRLVHAAYPSMHTSTAPGKALPREIRSSNVAPSTGRGRTLREHCHSNERSRNDHEPGNCRVRHRQHRREEGNRSAPTTTLPAIPSECRPPLSAGVAKRNQRVIASLTYMATYATRARRTAWAIARHAS